MAYLELKNIKKSYFLGKEEFPVLKGINLDFDLGDFVSILGESGGGKSTLMNIIGGLDRNFSGEVLVKGNLLDHKQEKELDRYRRETIGYIYQSYNLVSHLSVLDNVLVSLDMTTLNKKQREARAKELLQKVGLEKQIKKYPNQLSGGQKQRVAIARALASDPKVIIADEPTGALDAENTQEVLELLNDIAKEGRLVITVTHSQAVADAGTRIVRLADGQIESDERIKPAFGTTDQEMLGSRPLPLMASVRTAAKHFKYNLKHNSLIILGTAIGLFAVVLFSGLGNGISGYIGDQIAKVANPQSVTVSRYSKETDGESGAAALLGGGNKQTFTADQIKQIKDTKHVSKVENSYSATNVNATVNGKSATITSLTNWSSENTTDNIEAGHAPKTNEVLLDKTTVTKRLGYSNYKDAIGQLITMTYMVQNGQSATNVTIDAKIAGVIKANSQGIPQGITSTQTMQNALEKAGLSTAPSSLNLKVDDMDNVKATTKKIDQIKDSSSNRLYKTSSVMSIIDQAQTYVNLATNVLATIAGISLIVSALMIIVTMYMSVSARTKEIGILRAIGESKSDIQWLFITESLITGLLSAVFATGLAFVAEAAVNAALKGTADYAFVQITAGNVITAFVLAILISLFAAMLPARRASKLNPIDALAAD